MNKAIIGRKVGMTQIFTPEGKVIPVTVVEAGPCPVVQIKTVEKDGYAALKLGFDETTEKALNKPQLGQFKKAGVARKSGRCRHEQGPWIFGRHQEMEPAPSERDARCRPCTQGSGFHGRKLHAEQSIQAEAHARSIRSRESYCAEP